MDPQTASYYRAILFNDGQDTRPLPPSLLRLHAWSAKRCQAMGLGAVIAKASALSVVLTWFGTPDGKAFAREFTTIGDVFGEGSETPIAADTAVAWDAVAVGTQVLVNDKEKKLNGEYLGRRQSWIDVQIDGARRSFRATQVQVVGA